MDSYTFSLVLGGVGLVAMAATGVSHSGGHATHSATASAPGGHAAGHGATAHGHSTARAPVHSSGIGAAVLSAASPRTLFSLLVGFGLTGVALRPFLGGLILAAAAVAGALVFERLLVAPVWRFMFRFESNPAETLESSLLGEARATSGFDNNGQGLVTVEVDGQVVQCLGTLRRDDLELGVRVRAGDVLRVEDVDADRNRCTVSYVGRADVAQ